MVTLVARHAAAVTALGAACGLAVVWRLRTVVDAFLFDVDALDRGVLLLTVALLAGVAIVATLPPAWRAARVDPLRALRADS